MNYTGMKFETNKGTSCLIVEDKFIGNYLIINMDTYSTMASDKIENIEKLIKTITEKF